MKKIEYCLNVLHYCIYKADYKLHLWSNKINPFHLIHKLPFQQRRYKKLGIDPIKEINKVFENKNYGISMSVSGGVLLGILFFFFWGVVNFLIGTPKGFVSLTTPQILISILMSVILSYFFVFQNDKYLLYFKKFEVWTKSDKVKNSWFTFGFILVVICLFILSIK